MGLSCSLVSCCLSCRSRLHPCVSLSPGRSLGIREFLFYDPVPFISGYGLKLLTKGTGDYLLIGPRLHGRAACRRLMGKCLRTQRLTRHSLRAIGHVLRSIIKCHTHALVMYLSLMDLRLMGLIHVQGIIICSPEG